jgi:chromosome segregation ATPase
MSALSFKINAETDKLKSFITMLERLRQVLAEIPDSTKEFDVINRKIGEMEARVEQTMRKIAQMEQQAMDAASKAAASATTGTAGGGSTAGTAATQAETAAHHDLLGALKAANDEKTKAMAQIRLYSNEIARLKADVAALNKEEQQNGQLSAKKRAQVLDAAVSIEEYKQEISQLKRELTNQIKLEKAAVGSINEMSQALTRMRAVYENMSDAEREGAQGQTMLKNIELLDTKIKELDASMGIHTRNVGNYASGFNMLGFQIQQVARELPSLAYGPQIFFSAISNNLPMLADEIARAKKSVDELKKAGQTFTPVWKQIASSIFSWQTLLVAGVTVLTLYGKEITNWVASLFKGKEAALSLAQAQEKLNTTINEDGYAIGDQIAIIKELQIQWNKLGNNLSSKQQFIKDNSDRFKELDVAVNGVSDAENLLVKNTPNFIEALKLRAEAAAAQKLASESYEKALIEERKAQEQIAKGYHTEAFVGSPTTGGASFNAIDREYTEEEKAGLLAVANAARETADSYMNLKAAKELAARQLLGEAGIQEVGKEKAATEKDIRDLENAIQKLRDDALQAEIDSMKDGTAKKLAQIDLDYQKRARAIQEAEAEIRRLQDGELTKNQQAQIEALNKANEAQHGKERGRTLLSGQTSPEDLSSQFDEEIQSWNEYLSKYGTFREKLQATKDLYDQKIAKAGSTGERKTLEAERDASVAEIEVQAGQWIRELTGKTKDELSALKADLEASLQTLKSEYNALDSSDSDQGQKLRGEINQTQAKINAVDKAASSAKLSPKDNAIKKWQRLEKTLGDIADGFEGIGDAVGGTTGEVISAAGEIATNATSMISSIVTLTESSAAAITTTSTTATSAIKAVERASVILAIIQAVLTIATKIASLFNNDDEKQAEIDRLQGRIEQLQWELDNANAIRLQENSFNAIQKVKDAYNDATKAILSAYGKLSPFGEAIVKRINAAKIEEKAIKSIADAYSNLKYTDSNLLGENKFSDTRDKLNNLAEQQLLLQKQINAENDKKKTDKSKIKEWERQMQELGEEAAEVINEVVETIIGGTAEDIAKELGDAFIEAFLEGEDAAKAWGEKVDEIVADIMKQMLVSKFVEERIGDIFDQYKSKWFKDGVFVGIDGVIDSMGNFADDLNKVGEEFQAIWDSLPAETKELLGNAGAARQEATERGFQTMSQDTGDELNGRFTDIQGKITDIRGYVMAQTQSIIGLLTSMANIETAMYASVQVNNELLRYAVMTYMEIVEINGNTAAMKVALQGIQEDIAAIKRNTSEL